MPHQLASSPGAELIILAAISKVKRVYSFLISRHIFVTMAVAGGGEGLGAVGLSQPRPSAAANTRTQNSGKDHKLWPGRFPGTGEYGPKIHGNCVIMLKDLVFFFISDRSSRKSNLRQSVCPSVCPTQVCLELSFFISLDL